ncbi:DUF1540 domain-containing protein [Sandaracinus amylolyticus]|uniref:DUF1540 domain-containing protein n=1 Tax=Sandaracinus amylolyticus TaxID=927083 RepID=A0A0F6W9J0_9BACT|nr:DUF1540 domain-containing protein [Sandaracinus amylolyticus]AKF10906.1 hypothetical protein DB32_008055 [Sandaracinus amylolyticus]
MKFTIEMPDVSACGVERCAYNVHGACHAKAITVGDGVHPGCDTFTMSIRHTDGEVQAAGVGACKVAVCKYNHDLECDARSIEVDVDEEKDEATCVTFELE